MDTTTNYEAPRLDRLGSVAELTEAASLVNSDNGLQANNAYSNP
jgi:hypothetical protein